MPEVTRLIIVRRGNTTLFNDLRKRFPDAIVLYDRRTERSSNGKPSGRLEQRTSQGAVMSSRGFYVSRQRPSR